MTPTTLQSCLNGSGFEDEFTFPCGYAQGATIKREQDRSALILHLFKACRPFTVVWLVAFQVVDALKRIAFGTLAHVSKEARKIVAPFRSHLNTSAPIVLVTGDRGVVAASFRSRPSAIFSRPTALMFRGAFTRPLTEQATAALRATITNAIPINSGGVPAVALEQPPCPLAVLARHAMHGNQAAVTQAGNIQLNGTHSVIIHGKNRT